MIEVPSSPGLSYQQVPQRTEPSPLRSDVAGFVGRTRRGPVGKVVRVEGYQEFLHHFGGLHSDFDTPYAIRGYFENGGVVAHIVRVLPDDPNVATSRWVIGDFDDRTGWNDDFPAAGRFRSAKYLISATSAGGWADGLCVEIAYTLNGPGGLPNLSLVVRCEGEPTEYIRTLTPSVTQAGKTLEELIAKQSKLIRLTAIEESRVERIVDSDGESLVGEDGRVDTGTTNFPILPGPQWRPWSQTLAIENRKGAGAAVDVVSEYQQAIRLLCEEPEVAVLATPSLYDDVDSPIPLIRWICAQTASTQDRAYLIDTPPRIEADVPTKPSLRRDALIAFAEQFQRVGDSRSLRAAAIYHPWIRVDDPLADIRAPLRTIPPSGHVAGLISRVDRERGAHYTPANVPLLDAVDVEVPFDREIAGPRNEAGVNLVRCLAGKGLDRLGRAHAGHHRRWQVPCAPPLHSPIDPRHSQGRRSRAL